MIDREMGTQALGHGRSLQHGRLRRRADSVYANLVMALATHHKNDGVISGSPDATPVPLPGRSRKQSHTAHSSRNRETVMTKRSASPPPSSSRLQGPARARVFNAFADRAAKAIWFAGRGVGEEAPRIRFPGRRARARQRRPKKGCTVHSFDASTRLSLPNERIIYTYGLHLDETAHLGLSGDGGVQASRHNTLLMITERCLSRQLRRAAAASRTYAGCSTSSRRR